MEISLIVCTYQRPQAVITLLQSLQDQVVYPDQILVVDGSLDNRTESLLNLKRIQNLEYFKVPEEHRGLTRQRNFGISKVNKTSEIVAFLDDDTVPEEKYFEELLKTYQEHPGAVGVGGYATNENVWERIPAGYQPKTGEFVYDGWKRVEGSRFTLRRKLGLAPDSPPGKMPDFSHGYSTGFLPPSGKTYEVEFFTGCAMSFKRTIVEQLSFSPYFEGYGLYEDLDYCLRASRLGPLYVNTAAQLHHYHDEGGRPNLFKYGQMVVRNGWYVWRVKYPHPTIKARAKWYATSFLLALVRLGNAFTGKEKRLAVTEAGGRLYALALDIPLKILK